MPDSLLFDYLLDYLPQPNRCFLHFPPIVISSSPITTPSFLSKQLKPALSIRHFILPASVTYNTQNIQQVPSDSERKRKEGKKKKIARTRNKVGEKKPSKSDHAFFYILGSLPEIKNKICTNYSRTKRN